MVVQVTPDGPSKHIMQPHRLERGNLDIQSEQQQLVVHCLCVCAEHCERQCAGC